MATSKKQRWGIMIILVATVLGTLGSFAVMILSTQASQQAQAEYQKLQANYEKELAEYNKKTQAQADELSAKYYPIFSPYASRVGSFDMASVTQVSTEDLVVGDGAAVDGSTKFAAYYIGWDANGKVFDQSIENGKLKAPLSIDGLDNASLIDGWKEGMKGMKIGGIRLLTIPSDKAYGEAGSTDSSGKQTIAANMPLKFVVMAISAPEAIAQPDMTKLIEAYSKIQAH